MPPPRYPPPPPRAPPPPPPNRPPGAESGIRRSPAIHPAIAARRHKVALMMLGPFSERRRSQTPPRLLTPADARHLDRPHVGLVLAVDRSLDRPPREGVLTGGGQEVEGRRPGTVGEGPLRVDGPPGAVPGPGRLAEAAVGVERPGPDEVLGRVDADDLGAGDRGRLSPLREDGEPAPDERLGLGPLVGDAGLQAIALALPGADQPGEVFQLRP